MTTTGGINTPIFTSSAYDYLNREEPPYPRYFNTVNQDVVVKKICALENAEERRPVQFGHGGHEHRHPGPGRGRGPRHPDG